MNQGFCGKWRKLYLCIIMEGGADVKVTATSQIAAMYLRKQNIYTERKIYPYPRLEDLRLDLLLRIRVMAANNTPR